MQARPYSRYKKVCQIYENKNCTFCGILGQVGIPFGWRDHAKKEPIPHHSGHPLLEWGELPDSGSAARLTHASPVGRNLSFYVDLYVRPLFFMSATVRLSAPTSFTDLATFSHAIFLVLVLIPEEREPNKMLFLASTSEISTSTSHSLKVFFLPFSIISFLLTSALLQAYLY